MIRRVDAACAHAARRFHEEWPQRAQHFFGSVHFRDGRRRGHVVDHEAGIRRRVEVGGEQVDIALGSLRALQKLRSQANPFQDFGHAVMLRLRRDPGGRRRLDQAARRASRMHPVLIRHTTQPGIARICNLRPQQIVQCRIVARHHPRVHLGRRGGCARGQRSTAQSTQNLPPRDHNPVVHGIAPKVSIRAPGQAAIRGRVQDAGLEVALRGYPISQGRRSEILSERCQVGLQILCDEKDARRGGGTFSFCAGWAPFLGLPPPAPWFGLR